jgi:hypothetical protein
MTAQSYCNGPKATYTLCSYKEAPVQRGKWKTLSISLTPPPPPLKLKLDQLHLVWKEENNVEQALVSKSAS